MRSAALAVVIVATAAAGCGPTAPPVEPTPPAEAHATPPAVDTTGVHAIDWMNRAYPLQELGDVTVVNGMSNVVISPAGTLVPAPDDAPPLLVVQKPVFVDVDSDGHDEAVIVSALHMGGTGVFSSIAVYTVHGNDTAKPDLLGVISGGDRGNGGVIGVDAAGHDIVIHRAHPGENDPACCPSQEQIEHWRWNGGAFVENENARKLAPLASPASMDSPPGG